MSRRRLRTCDFWPNVVLPTRPMISYNLLMSRHLGSTWDVWYRYIWQPRFPGQRQVSRSVRYIKLPLIDCGSVRATFIDHFRVFRNNGEALRNEQPVLPGTTAPGASVTIQRPSVSSSVTCVTRHVTPPPTLRPRPLPRGSQAASIMGPVYSCFWLTSE